MGSGRDGGKPSPVNRNEQKTTNAYVFNKRRDRETGQKRTKTITLSLHMVKVLITPLANAELGHVLIEQQTDAGITLQQQ